MFEVTLPQNPNNHCKSLSSPDTRTPAVSGPQSGCSANTQIDERFTPKEYWLKAIVEVSLLSMASLIQQATGAFNLKTGSKGQLDIWRGSMIVSQCLQILSTFDTKYTFKLYNLFIKVVAVKIMPSFLCI